MAVDIGPRIGIDGEKEFRKGLQNINQQLRTLSSEMKAVTSAFDDNDKSQEALSAQTGVLNRQIDAQEQKLRQLRTGLDQAAKKFGENDTRTLRWAQAVNEARAQLKQMDSQLAKFYSAANEANDATGRLTQTISRQEAKLSQLRRQYSNAVLTVGAGSKEAKQLSKQINALSNDLQRNKTQLDRAENSVRHLGNAMDDAGRNSQGFGQMLAGAFTGGAISGLVQSAVSGVQDLVESTSEYRKIMASLESSSQRAGYSAEETTQTYNQLYGVLGDEQTAATTTANLQALGLEQEQLTQLTDAAIGAWATYGDSIPIDGLAEAINETIRVGQVTGTFADALNWAGTSEDAFNEKLAAAGSEAERANLVLQELANQGLVEAGEGWRQNNQDIVNANLAAAGLSETMAGFGGILSPIVTEAKTRMNELLQGVLGIVQVFQSDGLSAGVAAVGDVVNNMIAAIQERLPEFYETAQEMVLQMVEGFTASMPTMIDAVSDALTSIFDYFAENAPTLIEKGGEILGSLGTGIIDAIPGLVAKLPDVISSITGFLASGLPALAETGIDLVKELGAGMISAIPDILKQLPKLVNAIADGVYDVVDAMVGIGVDLVEGLWEGIKSAGSWLADKLFGWADGIIGGIKDFFGINSPSTVFRDEVGRYMAEGIGEGFTREMDSVASRMERAIPTPTIETVQDAAAGMVNGLAAVNQGYSFPREIVLKLEDGREIARWLLPDLRAAARANPEVVTV